MSELTPEERRAILAMMDEPVEPEPPEADYTAPLQAIAASVEAIKPVSLENVAKELAKASASVSREIKSLEGVTAIKADIQSIAKAIGKIKPAQVDLTALAAEIRKNTAAIKSLVEVMSLPKRLIFDRNGEIMGVEIDTPVVN